jgi:hypothetical protein
MNSWQQPVATEPSVGTLHLIDEDSRVRAVNDSSVTDTWEEADLSDYVPRGTRGLYGFLQITTDTDNQGVLLVRDGASMTTNRTNTRIIRVDAGGAWGAMAIIKATNGIFDYVRLSSDHEIDAFQFWLWGYYL